MKKKAVFLDRDGVINIDFGYVHTISAFEFCEGIFEFSTSAKKKGYHLIVVTNQAGIARGYYSENEFLKLSSWMCEQFQSNGSPISKVYFSPNHPVYGLGRYKTSDNRRKPGVGMILEAANEFDLDLKKSILIGDNRTDIIAGLSAGIGCNILFGNSLDISDLGGEIRTVSSLFDAQKYL